MGAAVVVVVANRKGWSLVTKVAEGIEADLIYSV
jgi:hypothetical protein